MKSISFNNLTETQKVSVLERLELRKIIYLAAQNGLQYSSHPTIILVGDRPGPAAPKDPLYHHTPFYSTKHCSGWLNSALELAEIPENRLTWINAYDRHGQVVSSSILKPLNVLLIVLLGANAMKWYALHQSSMSNYQVEKFTHPQYHKRFLNKQPYPLIDFLKHNT